ncbi:response regulator [Sulfurimonas sp. MAG313]|nr:ATP-binding protein [Sulfurimonas sp. MAG313]MDF1880114.1 response regulator [Sulfurimonas sp. MAG313]
MDLETVKVYSGGLNILYVEDSLTLRSIITKKIQPIFKSIKIAKDGLEALKLYEENSSLYDIVLTDLEMPNMDGQELSQKILSLDFTQKIIVISSVEDFRKIIELINLGVYKFISKPVEDEQLYQVLSDVSQQICIQRLQDAEQEDVAKNNIILQKRENEHMQTMQEFERALDSSALVSKTDIQGNLTYVNKRFCKLSGYNEEELIGHNNRLLKSGNMDNIFFEQMWRKILNKKSFRGLFENKSKVGEIYFIESYITPILDLEGTIVEFMVISHNMTNFVRSLHDIQKVQESKEYFFINISHEMKTPLNAIIGLSSILQTRCKENIQTLGIVDTINESGNDLKNLVESILDLGKIKDETLVLQVGEFNPNTEFIQCLQRYKKKAKSKEQEFIYILDDTLPKCIFGDCKRIVQMLSAFFDNAIKFSSEKGKIHIEIFYEEENLHCLVKDNGIGIALKDQKNIFNMQQLDSHFSRAHEGAGLGLTLASGLGKLMQAEILIKSIPDKGSSFEIIIPLKVYDV